ncbi:MAG: conjugal transfer protein TraG, partial [Komagataeibacter saccharivorans]
ELVMLSGCPPIRALKVRYYQDRRFTTRILPPPHLAAFVWDENRMIDVWSARVVAEDTPSVPSPPASGSNADDTDDANSGVRREPELPEHEDIAPERPDPAAEFEIPDSDPDVEAQRAAELRRQGNIIRQAGMDRNDGLELGGN